MPSVKQIIASKLTETNRHIALTLGLMIIAGLNLHRGLTTGSQAVIWISVAALTIATTTCVYAMARAYRQKRLNHPTSGGLDSAAEPGC